MKNITNFKLIFLYFISTLVLEFFSEFFLNTKQVLFFSLSENFNIEQVNKIITLRERWHWLLITSINILFLLKIIIISSIVYVGTFFYSKVKVSLKNIIQSVLKAEFIFLLVGVLKMYWFYFFQTNYTLEDIQYFYPLSALNMFGYKELDPWLIYPLQTLNLFEVAYWLLLSYYIGKIASPTKNLEENKYPIDFGLKIVASSYGSALLLWVVVVMFFTLNYS